MFNFKRALLTGAFMAVSALSWADTSTAPVEAEPAIPAEHLTQLCVAALKSEQAYLDTARNLEIGKEARDRLVCNEMSLEDFTANYRLIDENTIATVQ